MYVSKNNSPQTTLTNEITATEQTIPVADISKLPAAPNIVSIGSGDNIELVYYAGISGSTLTGCVRGYHGTTASIWYEDTPVYRAYTSYDHDTFKGNIEDLASNKLDKTGDGSSTTVTFTEAETLANPATGESQATLWGKILKLFNQTSGHDHDGTNSKKIAYSNVTDTPLKATGAEINTGTEETKIVTPKAIADSNIVLLNSNLTKVRLTEDQVINADIFARVELDTIDSDIYSNYITTDWYGSASALRQAKSTSNSTTINDDTGDFPALIIGSKVVWASDALGTTNTGYGYVTNRTATSLSIIKTFGADFAASYYYYIRNMYYVVPISGYYLASTFIRTNGGETGKRYAVTLMANENNPLHEAAIYTGGLITEISATSVAHLNAGTKLWTRVKGYSLTSSWTLSYVEKQTFMSIILLKAD